MDEQGFTQESLAAEADVGHHTVFRAVSKGVIPRGLNIAKIARALGVSTSDLFANPNAAAIERQQAKVASVIEGLEQVQAGLKSLGEHGETFLMAWSKAAGANEWRRHVALFFLTSDVSHLDHSSIPTKLKSEMISGLRFLGLAKKASAP